MTIRWASQMLAPLALAPWGMALLVVGCQSGPPQPQDGGMGAGGGQPPTPVEIVTVETGSIRDSSIFVASLDSRQAATINPQVNGQISQVFVQLGDQVAAGTPLFQIDSSQQQAVVASRTAGVQVSQATIDSARATLGAAQADLARTEADVEFARTRQERYAQLFGEGAISREFLAGVERDLQLANAAQSAQLQQIAALESAVVRAERDLMQSEALAQEQQVQLRFFQVTAPLAGIVGEVPVRVGDLVSPQTQLTSITQSQTLELAINVPLEQAPDLSLGIPVDLLGAGDQALSSSQISFISPSVNSSTQSVLARAVFDNTSGQLRADQFVRVRLTWGESTSPLIPVNSVARVAGQTFVYVAQPPEDQGSSTEGSPTQGSPEGPPALIASQRAVELGRLQDNQYQVISGIAVGEQVVATGLQKIFNGAPIMDEQVFQQMMQQMQGGGGSEGIPPGQP